MFGIPYIHLAIKQTRCSKQEKQIDLQCFDQIRTKGSVKKVAAVLFHENSCPARSRCNRGRPWDTEDHLATNATSTKTGLMLS